MTLGFSVAAATVALSDRLQLLIGDAVPGARVTTLNPSAESLRSGEPIVNLYLFRTVRNGFISNDDLPTRDAAGNPLASSVLKLDLDYMITFFGSDAKLDPQRLFGLVVGGLNAAPYVEPDAMRASFALTPWLGSGSVPDLPSDGFRITPLDMPPDAMARLWSEFVNVPYQLTQLYTATPVSLVTVLPVAPVLPVRRIGMTVTPSPVAITSIVNARDPSLPLQGGGQMAIRLANPGRQEFTVLLNGVAAQGVTVGFDAEGYAALLVDLPANQARPLAAGPLAVQVIRTTAHQNAVSAKSRIVQTAIVPSLAEPPAVDNGQLIATLTLPVAPDSLAAALLFARGAPERPSRRIPCLPRTAPSHRLVTPLLGVPAGQYLVSMEIDGVATLLDFDSARAAYSGPTIAVAGMDPA